MSSQTFSEMCEEAAVRLYLQQSGIDEDFLAHHGIKGMKWGIRRFQNPDGTLTAAGKERYRSIYAGGKGKASEEFYRKAVAKDSSENWLDLRSSLPVQHVISKLHNDAVKYYEQEEQTNVVREKLIREGFNKLSADEKKAYETKAKDEFVKYAEEAHYLDADESSPSEHDQKLNELAEDEVKRISEFFDSKDRGFTIDDYTMRCRDGGFFFSAYGQWYAEHAKDIASDPRLVACVNKENAFYDQMESNMRSYVQEFTKGFGQLELSDLSKRYGKSYTVDDRLEAVVRDTFYNFARDRAYMEVIDSEHALKRSKEQSEMFKRWRNEAFKKNNMSKLY